MIFNSYDYVTVVGEGSCYPCKGGGCSIAFYYNLDGVRQKRKVITAKTAELLEEKVNNFLKQESERFIHEHQSAVSMVMPCAPVANRPAPTTRDTDLQEYGEIPERKTFAEVGAEWLVNYKKRLESNRKKLSYSSYESRGCSLKRINEVIGSVDIDTIDNEMAEELIDKCCVKSNGEFYSKSHVDKLQQVFLLVMKYGNKKGYCTNHIDKVELPDQLGEPDKNKRFIDEDKLDQIYAACKENKRYYTLVKLLAATGLRQEEAFALTVDDFLEREILIEDKPVKYMVVDICKTVVETSYHHYDVVNSTKTKKSTREVPIDMNTYQLVMDYYKDCKDEEENEPVQRRKMLREANGTEGYIFLDIDSKPINKRTFERNFRLYLERRGIMDISLHMFRHSYASLASGFIDFEDMVGYFGDNQKTVQERYYSSSERKKAFASLAIGEMMGKYKN